MFCPKCSAYLTERDLIKTNVKYAPGNVAVEYEAQCPKCHVDMGVVSWGQLTVNPALERELEKAKEKPAAAEEAQPAPQQAGNTGSAGHSVKNCPHCGKPLPAGY